MGPFHVGLGIDAPGDGRLPAVRADNDAGLDRPQLSARVLQASPDNPTVVHLEIRELNAVHALAGSTEAMLERLDELLDARQEELDQRISELGSLRDQIGKYRAHVGERVEALRSGKASTS